MQMNLSFTIGPQPKRSVELPINSSISSINEESAVDDRRLQLLKKERIWNEKYGQLIAFKEKVCTKHLNRQAQITLSSYICGALFFFTQNGHCNVPSVSDLMLCREVDIKSLLSF